MLAPFLSMVFHGLLGTCSFLNCLCVLCFEKCLLRDNPCISPQGCDEVVLKIVLKGVCVKSFFEQVLKILPTRKKDCSFSFPLDNAILLLRSR